jgi:hypothetical protein
MALARGAAFADFLTVLGDVDARDFAAALGGGRRSALRAPLTAPLGVDFDADFFDDFRAIRLPFVAFSRSKE